MLLSEKNDLTSEVILIAQVSQVRKKKKKN